MSDGEKGFHDVFLHVGAGVLLALERFEKGVVPVGSGDACHDGKSLHAVVGLPRVGGMAIASARPAHAVDGRGDAVA